jgi:hypothetical protein
MVNSTSVIVMFDSGVSRSFIFAVYVERHNIPVAMLKCRMVVSFLRGDMPARLSKGEHSYKVGSVHRKPYCSRYGLAKQSIKV